VIRQAISCDICGTEKRQTNHWFVAYEQAGELRVSGWTSRHRYRACSKHLCGQTCLHKLVDEFMAKSIAVRAQHLPDDLEPELGIAPPLTDASLTSTAACPQCALDADFESSARLLPSSAPILPGSLFRRQPELVTMPARNPSRRGYADAWERERARERRAGHQ